MFYSRQPKNRFLDLSQRYKITSLVFIGNILSQLGIDLYTPSFPAMQQAFHASSTNIQLSLTLYMFGYAALQLVFGYLADKIGRRPSLLIGYLCFIFATVMIIFTHNIMWFLIFRFLQGGGGAAFQVCMRTTLRDLFSGIELTKVSGYYSTVWALVPILAPAIGGYIQTYFNWQMQFKMILGASVFFFILVYKLVPETRSQEVIDEGKYFLAALKSCMTNRSLILFACIVSITGAIIMSFIISSPFLLQLHFNLSPIHYGWAIVVIAFADMCGSFIVGRYAHIFGSKRILVSGTIVVIISALLLLGLHVINPHNLWFIIAPMCLLYGIDGVLYPAAAGKAYDSIKANAGVSTAFYGTILVGGCAVALALATHLPHTTIVPYALLTLGLAFIVVLLLLALRKEL